MLYVEVNDTENITNLTYLFKKPQRLQKLIYLHLTKDCFMKISLQSTGHHYLKKNI